MQRETNLKATSEPSSIQSWQGTLLGVVLDLSGSWHPSFFCYNSKSMA
jgi:hypothetical protein